MSIPYHRWHFGILRESKDSWTGNVLKAWGEMQFGIPMAWVGSVCMCEGAGGFCSEFPDGEDGLKLLIWYIFQFLNQAQTDRIEINADNFFCCQSKIVNQQSCCTYKTGNRVLFPNGMLDRYVGCITTGQHSYLVNRIFNMMGMAGEGTSWT